MAFRGELSIKRTKPIYGIDRCVSQTRAWYYALRVEVRNWGRIVAAQTSEIAEVSGKVFLIATISIIVIDCSLLNDCLKPRDFNRCLNTEDNRVTVSSP